MDDGATMQCDLVGRARALIPLLTARSAEAERLRRLPDDVVQALDDAGMFALMRPRRYGGHQADITTYMRALAELARGDGSVGWLISQANNSQWLAAQMGPALREDVFAGATSRGASVLLGQSTVRRAPGGFVLDGRWPFCSGIHHADWVLLAAVVADDGAPPDPGFFAVPGRDLHVEDDWHVTGLAATGSNSVAARELFVPAHRFTGMIPLATNTTSLAEVDAPLYRAPLMPFVMTTAGIIAVGMAEAMLEHFKTQLPGRPLSYTNYASRAEAPATHVLLGEAVTKLRAARLLFTDAAATIERSAAAGEPMPIPERIATRDQAVYALHLCRDVTGALLDASGGRALQLANPLQRIDRDLRALSLHPVYSLATSREFRGRVELGMPPNTPFP
jgi:alkylation response protein AidB-like acyl-CoA dehydrogenase